MNIANSAHANDLLRQERIQHNWTQRDIADMLGTTVVTVNRWERGIQHPRAHHRQKLCALFERSAKELGLWIENYQYFDEVRIKTVFTPENQINCLYFWSVPYLRNPFFTGREEILCHLHHALKEKGAEAHAQSWVLTGLGGIGKTQTALEYAYRYADDYAAIFWINAETYESILSSLISIAEVLDLPERREQEQYCVITSVIRWLSNHSDWLLILDNVERPELVKSILPPTTHGSLLFTSRRQALGLAAWTLDLEQMTLEEGTQFLLHRAKLLDRAVFIDNLPANDDCANAREIVDAMGGLPLALDQAGAYIEETACSLADYLERLQHRQGHLLKRRGNLVSEYPHTVDTTVSSCFEAVKHINPVAANLMRLCAFLSADAIPEEMLMQKIDEAHPAQLLLEYDPLAFDELLAVLRQYSLLHRDAKTKTLTVHRLTQVVLTEMMDQDTQRQWAERVVQVVNQAFPKGSDVNAWKQCQRMLPHVEACVKLIKQWKLVSADAGRLLNQVGVYVRERGFYTRAEELPYLVRDMYVEVVGLEHLDVAQCLNDLA